MKQERENKASFDSIGERINQLLSLKFSDGVTNVDIYNALYGNDKKQDSSKKNTISDLRAGRGINLNILMLISQKFGVSLDWLVYGKESSNKPLEEKTTHELIRAIVKRIMSDDRKIEKNTLNALNPNEGIEPNELIPRPNKFTSSRLEYLETYFHKAVTTYNMLASNGAPSATIQDVLLQTIPEEFLFYGGRDSKPTYVASKNVQAIFRN